MKPQRTVHHGLELPREESVGETGKLVQVFTELSKPNDELLTEEVLGVLP